MSYDLGRWWEQLNNRFEGGGDDGGGDDGKIDFNVPADYYDGDQDGDGIPDWADTDWGPDPKEDDEDNDDPWFRF